MDIIITGNPSVHYLGWGGRLILEYGLYTQPAGIHFPQGCLKHLAGCPGAGGGGGRQEVQVLASPPVLT